MASDPPQSISCFRPMLCVGSSAKDMVVRNCNVVVGGSLSQHGKKMKGWMFEEPLSPRVGCMGQIKRDDKVGLSSSSSSSTKGSKLNKLKKILSGKSLSGKFEGHYRIVSIVELDPPLPVPKRVPTDVSDAVSLWVRRGRRPLRPLKIQRPPPPDCRPSQASM